MKYRLKTTWSDQSRGTDLKGAQKFAKKVGLTVKERKPGKKEGHGYHYTFEGSKQAFNKAMHKYGVFVGDNDAGAIKPIKPRPVKKGK